jgi:hypothetical protein
VTWDGDLRFNGSGWSYHDFRGSRWCNIKHPENRNYLRNAYRVLLSRARQRMVIFVRLVICTTRPVHRNFTTPHSNTSRTSEFR